MKTSSSRTFVAFAVALMGTLGPHCAFAQQHSASDIAEARELFNQGKELRSKGDTVGALEKLKAAHALADTPLTGFELGQTYMLLGKLVEAEETFLSVARIPVSDQETPHSQAARRDCARLADQVRSRIPTLNIRITGVAANSVAVTIDGAVIPTAALAGPRLVNPGRHSVVAKSSSGGTAETDVDLKEGEARDVELKIVFTGGGPSAPVAPTTPVSAPQTEPPSAARSTERASESPPPPRSHVLEWSLLGGGAAVGAAGVVVMIIESGKTNDANSNHDKSAYDSAVAGWRFGLAGTVVGAAAMAAGGIVFAVSRGGEGTRTSRNSLWLGVAANQLRIGGTW